MSKALRRVLNKIALVDQHAHAVLREHPATLDEFRGLFSESAEPRQWPHVATAVTYRRAIRDLAEHLGCEADEVVVFERRRETHPAEYATSMLGATRTEQLFLDDGYPSPEVAFSLDEMGEIAGCTARPVLRIERVAEEAMKEPGRDLHDVLEQVRIAVATARDDGYVALKTVAAYRTGLAIEPADRRSAAAALGASGPRLEAKPLVDFVLWLALEVNAADPLPVQVHAGFGDGDLLLPSADPTGLKPALERFRGTPFVLLHCYPYVREAGWLAHVYPNVFFDLSLTIPHIARPADALREALELAPVSKLMYASDAARAPELYFLAARRWREALAEVLPELLPGEEEAAARAILRENALGLYSPGS